MLILYIKIFFDLIFENLFLRTFILFEIVSSFIKYYFSWKSFFDLKFLYYLEILLLHIFTHHKIFNFC